MFPACDVSKIPRKASKDILAQSRRRPPSACDELPWIVDVQRYPIQSTASHATHWRAQARRRYRETGICLFDHFLLAEGVDAVRAGIEPLVDEAYVSTTHSSVYLEPGDSSFPTEHPRREERVTRVGTLAEDQLLHSLLRTLHASAAFRRFIGDIVGVPRLYGYADGLTSVNVLVFKEGDQLGWHFDESDYAVTLLLSAASAGGTFEYVPNIRAPGNESYPAIQAVLAGAGAIRTAAPLCAGSLMIFRGRHSLHRVTAVRGGRPRLVAVLSYDSRPGMHLSEHDRRLFFGRIA